MMDTIATLVDLSLWPLAVLFFGLVAYETVRSQQSLKSIDALGSISTPVIPRLVHNFLFAFSGTKVLRRGYKKFKSQGFQLARNDGDVLVLPQELLEELSSLPASIASPHEALEHDLIGSYTGLDLILESRLHHSIVQRKLTPRLTSLTPDLERELSKTFLEYFPDCKDWSAIEPYQILAKVSGKLSARALVGPILCQHPQWLDISINYTENLFRSIVILRLFPSFLHPFVSRLLPSYWKGRYYVRSAKLLLCPVLADLIKRNDDGSWSPGHDSDYHVLAWLVDTAKGRDRDPATLAHVEVLLALASVHTTLLRMVNVLYDLIANPDCLQEVRREVYDTCQEGWNPSSYSKLEKLDSVLRESQRLSPPTILGMKRMFQTDYTFSTGLHVSKGTYACMPTFEIENDPQYTPNPTEFDGFRSYRLHRSKDDKKDHQFTSTTVSTLNFGYGKSACPGRFFASLVIKMVFVKLLTEYEFDFLPGTKRPRNVVLHEFLFPWPWDKILIKRKHKDTCPF